MLPIRIISHDKNSRASKLSAESQKENLTVTLPAARIPLKDYSPQVSNTLPNEDCLKSKHRLTNREALPIMKL
jgi:hypothetical protein